MNKQKDVDKNTSLFLKKKKKNFSCRIELCKRTATLIKGQKHSALVDRFLLQYFHWQDAYLIVAVVTLYS